MFQYKGGCSFLFRKLGVLSSDLVMPGSGYCQEQTGKPLSVAGTRANWTDPKGSSTAPSAT